MRLQEKGTRHILCYLLLSTNSYQSDHIFIHLYPFIHKSVKFSHRVNGLIFVDRLSLMLNSTFTNKRIKFYTYNKRSISDIYFPLGLKEYESQNTIQKRYVSFSRKTTFVIN